MSAFSSGKGVVLLPSGLRTLGEGARGQEAPHHVIVLELVSDGVCMVWAGFLKEPLEVVCGRPRLTLVAACGSQDAPHVGIARLPVIAIIMVGRGRGPLKALLAPLCAALDALPTSMDGDVERCSHTATWGRFHASLGQAKRDRLVAGGVSGGAVPRMCSCKSLYAHLRVGSVRCARAAHSHSPSEPGGGLVAQHACPTATAGPRMRSQ
jgi:hypothetical protein